MNASFTPRIMMAVVTVVITHTMLRHGTLTTLKRRHRHVGAKHSWYYVSYYKDINNSYRMHSPLNIRYIKL